MYERRKGEQMMDEKFYPRMQVVVKVSADRGLALPPIFA
jgi:hypothetical protein